MASEVLVVASKVKAYAKKKGKRFSAEAIELLSDLIRNTVDAAVTRAEEDGRETIKGRDIVVEVKED